MKLHSFGKLFSLTAVLVLIIALACATAITASADEQLAVSDDSGDIQITVTAPFNEECGKVQLSWDAVDGATKYAVYLNGKNIANTRATYYTISSLAVAANGEDPIVHTFKIVALDGEGDPIAYGFKDSAAEHATEVRMEYENIVLPDCLNDGNHDEVTYCTSNKCGKEISRVNVTDPALGHTEVVDNAVDPTCTEDGLTEGSHCSVCDEILIPQEKIDMLGHTEGEIVIENIKHPTCTTNGSYDNVIYCVTCGEELFRETIGDPAPGHNPGEFIEVITVPVTCMTCGEGYDVSFCQTCGEEVERIEFGIEARGYHVDGEVQTTITVPATCYTEGYQNAATYCIDCGEYMRTDVQVIPELDHTPGEWITDVESTCIVNGVQHQICAVLECGAIIAENVPAPLGPCTEGEIRIENNVDPTCTVTGKYEEVVYCSVCDAQLKRTEVIVPATGHTESEPQIENKIPAKCEVDGCYDSVIYCTVCNEELSSETITIPALEHEYKDADCINPQTCILCGITVGNPNGHSFAPADCEDPETCICGETRGEALGHIYNYVDDNNATCTTDGTKTAECEREGCDKPASTVIIEGSALGHSYTNYVSDGNATCTEDGTMTANCDHEGCDTTDTLPDEGSTLGHSYTNYVSDGNATCTEDGTKTAKCDHEGCDTTDTLPDEGSALGHLYGEDPEAAWIIDNEPNCTEDGAKHRDCTRENCGYVDNAVITKLGHDYGEDPETAWVIDKEATCTEDGAKHRDCTRENCGYVDNAVITKLGHAFTTYTSNNNATCTEDATETAKCDRCDATDTRPINGSKLGHYYGENPEAAWVIDKEATCTEDGAKHRNCTRENCGFVDNVTLPKLGHAFNNYAPNGDATCTEDGTKTAKCDRCDATDTQPDNGSALGHNPVLEDNPDAFILYYYCSNCNEKTFGKVQIPVPYREPLLKGGIVVACLLVIILSIRALVAPATTTPFHKRRRY